MDSNSNKNTFQPNIKDNEFYGSYNNNNIAINTCGQQLASQRAQRQHFLAPYAMPPPQINNTMAMTPHQQLLCNSQGQSMYNTIMYGHGPGAQPAMYRSENTFPHTSSLNVFPAESDSLPAESWLQSESCVTNAEPEIKEKYQHMKYTDNKEKSASCCAPDLPHVYTQINKNFYYNKMDTQWFYGSSYDTQTYNELPSCSHISSNSIHLNECCESSRELGAKNIKSVKYCSIQKCPDPDTNKLMYTMYTNNKYDTPTQHYNQQPYNQNNKMIAKDYPANYYHHPTAIIPGASVSETSTSTCLEINKKTLLDPCELAYYPPPQPFDVSKIDHDDDEKTDESNGGGESDIVVEDSDDEVTDESDELDNNNIIQQSCLVCNITTVNNDCFVVTAEAPLTANSNTHVSETLIKLFGSMTHFQTNSTYLCSTCMSLINTYDNLQLQFETVKCDLINKYKTTMVALKQYIDLDKHIVVPQQNTLKHDHYNKNSNNNNNKNKKIIAINNIVTVKRNSMRKICGSHMFKCRVCEKIFSLKKFYKFHMSKHKSRKSYLCERCGCHFVKHSNLLAHLRRHTKQHKLYCSRCNKGFVYERSLREHTCNNNNNNKKIVKSSSCNNLVDPNKTTCSVCGKVFKKHSDYKVHAVTHSTEKKFRCAVCGKTYKTLSNLNYHSRGHRATLPFNCNVCQKGFLRRENLQAHLNTHNGLKPFSCVICEKKFASRKNLDAHLKVHNGSTRKTACNVCGKQIIHGLAEHMRTHSNRKDISCDCCTMKFYTNGALAKHKKRKHENIEVL